MALGRSYRDLLSAIDDYGEFGRKQNRKEGVMRGFEMLNEVLSASVERKRRKQEAEQQRKDRAAEIEMGRQDDAKKEQARIDREQTQTNIGIETERLKKAAEKREKEELAAQNLPKVAEIKAMFRQAVEMKDRKSYLDAIDRYTDLDPEYQKKVPFDFYKDEFKSVMEPPPEPKEVSSSEKIAAMELEAITKIKDLKKRKAEGDQSVTDEMLGEAFIDLQLLDKSARDKLFEAGIMGDQPKPSPTLTPGEINTANINAGVTAPEQPSFYEFWKDDTPDAFVPPPMITRNDAAISAQASELRRLNPEKYPPTPEGMQLSYKDAKHQVDSSMSVTDQILNGESGSVEKITKMDEDALALIQSGHTPQEVADTSWTAYLAGKGITDQKGLVAAMRRLLNAD